MTLEVHLVLLEPADVELLAGGAALELAGEILFVVADDSMGDVSLAVCLERGRQAGRHVDAPMPGYGGKTHLVMIPVVLTPSVRWVTRNLPAFLMGS